MKKNKKIIIIAISVILILALIVGIIIANKEMKNEQNAQNTVKVEDIDIYDQTKISELKSKNNATADSNMYQIYVEYDGNQMLQIKPEIQYDTVLAGILKNDIPSEDEIDTILQKSPNKNGIWISEQSREGFMKLLHENNINELTINNEGYLEMNGEATNDQLKILKDAINSKKLLIIDCQGKTYSRDEMTGKIIEYPFEKMDPYQAVDVYRNEENAIIEVTTNEKGLLTSQQILEDFILNLN